MHIFALLVALAAPPSTAPSTPSAAQCDARKTAKVAVAVDATAPSALTAGVLARLTESCVSPIGVSLGADDVSKAKEKGARFLIRVSGKMVKTGEAKVEGVTLGTYRATVSAGVVRVSDAVVIGELVESASVMGPSVDAAAAHTAKPGAGAGSKGPVAWRVADRVVQALDAELSGASASVAASASSCARPTTLELVDVALPDGAEPLRAAVMQRLTERCVQVVSTGTPRTGAMKLELALASRIAVNTKLDKNGKMKPFEWVLTTTLTKDGTQIAKEESVSGVSLGVDAANAANNIIKKPKALDAMLAAADAIAAAAAR